MSDSGKFGLMVGVGVVLGALAMSLLLVLFSGDNSSAFLAFLGLMAIGVVSAPMVGHYREKVAAERKRAQDAQDAADRLVREAYYAQVRRQQEAMGSQWYAQQQAGMQNAYAQQQARQSAWQQQAQWSQFQQASFGFGYQQQQRQEDPRWRSQFEDVGADEPQAPPRQPPSPWRRALGIADDATVSRAIINTAYRSKAKEAHPDSGGSNEAMSALNVARKQALAEVLN